MVFLKRVKQIALFKKLNVGDRGEEPFSLRLSLKKKRHLQSAQQSFQEVMETVSSQISVNGNVQEALRRTKSSFRARLNFEEYL